MSVQQSFIGLVPLCHKTPMFTKTMIRERVTLIHLDKDGVRLKEGCGCEVDSFPVIMFQKLRVELDGVEKKEAASCEPFPMSQMPTGGFGSSLEGCRSAEPG